MDANSWSEKLMCVVPSILDKLHDADITPSVIQDITTPRFEQMGISIGDTARLERRASLDQDFEAEAEARASATGATSTLSSMNAPPAASAEIMEMICGLREDFQALRNPNVSNMTANLDLILQNEIKELETLLYAKRGSKTRHSPLVNGSQQRTYTIPASGKTLTPMIPIQS